MSTQLQQAVYARLSGGETLTGDQLAAQSRISSLNWRFGALRKGASFPCGVFWRDAGTDAMPNAPDLGIIENSIWRFEVWATSTDGGWFEARANDLELLFDQRRGATAMTLSGYNVVYDLSLFTPMQAPLHEEKVDAYYGLISFRIIEARP